MAIELLIPLREFPQSLSQRYLWCKSEVTFKSSSIGIRCWNISGLHGHKLFVCLEVEVCGKDSGTDQFLLQDIHEVKQVLWLTTTDIIYCIGRNGQAIFTLLAHWSTLHHSIHALYDVIDIGEVPAAVAVVEYLDSLALQQLVGKAEVCHVRTTGRTIYCKEAQARCGDIIQLRITVGKQLIALLGSCIQRHRIIYPVISTEWHLLIATINRT